MMVFVTALYAGAISLSLVYYSGSAMNAILLTMPAVVYVAGISGAIHFANYYRDVGRRRRGRRCPCTRGPSRLDSLHPVGRHQRRRSGLALYQRIDPDQIVRRLHGAWAF